MRAYIIRRLLFMIPILFLLSVLVFFVAHLTPGSPVDLIAGPTATQDVRAEIAAKYGLDLPLPVQYYKWLSQVVQGDLGRSLTLGRKPVATLIKERFHYTVELGLSAWLLAYLVAIPIGILAAVRQHSLFDNLSIAAAVVGASVPSFWLALLLILIFSVRLQWFPISGVGGLKALILPAIALALGRMAVLARIVRAGMLEVLGSDYVRTARAKGLTELKIILLHAFRNALLPLVSLAGLELGYLLGGAIIVETVFARPGLGTLMVQAVRSRDFPVVQGAVLILGISIVFSNLITDVLYTVIDPRIRYG